MTATMIATAIRTPLWSRFSSRGANGRLRGRLLHRQPWMDRPPVAEWGELRSERRDCDLGQGFRRPSALAMHHADRTHMTVEGEFAGALVEDLAVDLARLLGGEKDAERGYRIGTAAAEPLLAQCCRLWVLGCRDRAGHAGVSRGADYVYGDPPGRVLHCDDAGKRDDPQLCRAVIALPDIAEQTRGRRDHDDPPVILLAEQVDRRAVDVEVPGQMHVDDSLPILRKHVVKHLVTQDAGGVEDDVQAAKRVTRLLHHCQAVFEIGDRAVICGRLAARRLDLVDDLLRGSLVGALTAAAGAGIIDDDLGTVRGHQLGDLGADPTTGPSTDRHPPVEHAHPSLPLRSVLARVVAGRLVFVNQPRRDCGIIVAAMTKRHSAGVGRWRTSRCILPPTAWRKAQPSIGTATGPRSSRRRMRARSPMPRPLSRAPI